MLRTPSLSAVFQSQQQWGDIWRLTLGSPPSPSTSWMFILCSHLDLLLCGISSHFSGLLKAIPRADQGILVGYRWSMHTPMSFTASAHTWQHHGRKTPGTNNWCSGSHKHLPLFPWSGNHPLLHPKTSSQELEAFYSVKWTRTSLICRTCPLLAKGRLMKYQHIKDFKDN